MTNATLTMEINLAVIALAVAAVSALIAALTYQRAGDWRRSEAGRETEQRLNRHNERLTVLETRIEGLATKEDIAGVKAELDAVQDEVRLTRSGVMRIEGFLMDTPK